MSIAAKLNRLAVCGTLAWLTIGNGGLLSAEEDWAPVHTSRTPAATAATSRVPEVIVRPVAFETESESESVPHLPAKLPPPMLVPTGLPTAHQSPVASSPGGPRSCSCERCAGPTPRRHAHAKPAAQKPAAQKPGCLVYCVLDGVAGGIEHALRLKSPGERCGRSGQDVTTCGCGLCSKTPASKPVQSNRVRPLPKRLPAGSSTAVPMSPTVPMEVDTPLIDPPASPLSHPIEQLEPKTVPRLPAPVVPDELADPFEDDQAWRPGRNAAIKRSAYYE